jgi:hypothetical protein
MIEAYVGYAFVAMLLWHFVLLVWLFDGGLCLRRLYFFCVSLLGWAAILWAEIHRFWL